MISPKNIIFGIREWNGLFCNTLGNFFLCPLDSGKIIPLLCLSFALTSPVLLLLTFGIERKVVLKKEGKPGAERDVKPFYQIHELGLLPRGKHNRPAQVNAHNEVVGTNSIGNDRHIGYLWAKGKLSLVAPPEGEECEPYAINDNGSIVGTTFSVSTTARAFLSYWGKSIELPRLSGGSSIAYDINNRDEIVGGATENSHQRHPVLWDRQGIHDLSGVFTEKGVLTAINDRGEILGRIEKTFGYRNVIYSGGKLHNIRVFGGGYALANGLNNRGCVVGFGTKGTATHAFLYQNKKIEDLGTLGGKYSVALSINDPMQIVGTSNGKDRVNHACLWSEGKIFDLNDQIDNKEGWLLESADFIGNSGAIIGHGKHRGKNAAYILIPR